MHKTIQNLTYIENQVKSNLGSLNEVKLPKIIAVSKTFKMDKILPLIKHGHKDFGENKVQEAVDKWTDIKSKKSNIRLHMIGKLQTNKVKFVVKLFDFIHSVDGEKLAKKIVDEQLKINRKVKVFIQVNVGEESQKSGISLNEINDFVIFCKEINLDVIGFMCIPPANIEPTIHFEKMKKINQFHDFNDLSMGMSSDYLEATKHNATYLRIGSKIFGERS